MPAICQPVRVGIYYLLVGVLAYALNHPSLVSAAVVINEILPDPSDPNDESEWIELYNSDAANVSLNNYSLNDVAKTYSLSGYEITSHGYLVIHKRDSRIFLNNDGDHLSLVFNQQIIHEVEFNHIPTNQSYGQETDGSGNWVVFEVPSPNAPNRLSAATLPTSPPENTAQPITPVHFSEIYPCPDGSDEWIELCLNSNSATTVDQWVFKDDGNNTHVFSAQFTPHGYHLITLPRAILNNSGATLIYLQTPAKPLIPFRLLPARKKVSV